MSSNPNPPPDDLASSARRRLLMRGGLKAAPLAMTLVGASALGQTAMSSSAAACLRKQPTDPTSVTGTTFVTASIVRFGNGNGANSADFVTGSSLQAVATAQGTTLSYTGTNGAPLSGTGYVALRIGANSAFAGVSLGDVLMGNDPRITSAGSSTPTGSVFVRIDASGNVIGFFYPTNTAIGGSGGTALSASCQTSFVNRPR